MVRLSADAFNEGDHPRAESGEFAHDPSKNGKWEFGSRVVPHRNSELDWEPMPFPMAALHNHLKKNNFNARSSGTKTLPLKDLHVWQGGITPAKIQPLRDDVPPIEVAKLYGKYIVRNGNHRATSAFVEGRPNIQTNLTDFDLPANRKYVKNYGMNNDRSRAFRDALRSGLSLDAAFGYAEAAEAFGTGKGMPLARELIHNCIRDSASQGGAPSEMLKRAVDRRMTFQGSRDATAGQKKLTATIMNPPHSSPVPGPKPTGGALAPKSPTNTAAVAVPAAKPAAVPAPKPKPKPATSSSILGGLGGIEHGIRMGTNLIGKMAASKARARATLGDDGEGMDLGDGTAMTDELFSAGPDGRVTRSQMGDRARRRCARDELSFGKNDLGSGSGGLETGAVSSENRSEPQTLPGAYSSTSTESGSHGEHVGDRMGTFDAFVNRIRGRRLGNLKRPTTRDGAAFEHVERSVAAKGAHDPAALAAYIGRRSMGKKAFQAKAAAGRRAT